MLKNNDIYTIQAKDNIEYLTFNRLLEYPEVKHAYILKTNNMNFRLGNKRENMEMVRNNLKKTCEALNFNFENIARPNYMHTGNVKVVEYGFNHDVQLQKKPDLSGDMWPDTDCLISGSSGIPIVSTNADCNLILIFDPIMRVIANVHAGWRGTFAKIVKNTIIKMIEEYGSFPDDIICFFCPSIRKCHFEVDEDVYLQCKELFDYSGKMDEIATLGDIKEGKQKYFIDTVLINKILLKEAGILEENIVDSGICSVCESDKIHSKRAEGDNFGLGAAIIQLN